MKNIEFQETTPSFILSQLGGEGFWVITSEVGWDKAIAILSISTTLEACPIKTTHVSTVIPMGLYGGGFEGKVFLALTHRLEADAPHTMIFPALLIHDIVFFMLTSML